MGMYEDAEAQHQHPVAPAPAGHHRDIGPGGFVSPPISPRSPGDAALHALLSEGQAPLSRQALSVAAAELRRHQIETGMPLPYHADLEEAIEDPVAGTRGDAGTVIVDPSNPLGAWVSIEDAAYVIEAPTPGVPRERLSLEIVGLRRLELVVASAEHAAGSGSSPSREGEVLETFEVEGPAAGAMPRRRAGPAGGARVDASPARKTTHELKCGVSLPGDCDIASASSTYKDGVLRVTVPRVPEGSFPSGLALAEAPLVEEVEGVRRMVVEARERLIELEASAKDAEERLRVALHERGAALEEARTELNIL
eukprot:CAMPEP_0173387386 /NCGR_PEP_ID=MMETSP1356-20130122/9900_1 /TAXON_ID=77927 ORGANISM="Hemiselmis virescens, Strain PCC157" /NCGR_SAMPLE_ID=MMETSP1356 /ASSEMBLY_ACC=CAM_ASM_000847 /LENGTH=309 /DNA_ID=CAMNT_0014343985 /DNA_START=318 /DNA_END=1247 /DNA_ORIENTATION=-